MRRSFILGVLLFGLSVFFSMPIARAQDVSSEELINHALEHDGQVVVYQGELIGAFLKRGSFVWLNLNDGKNVIGVWASRDLASPVEIAGDYMHRGDIVKIKGVFHRSCAEHGGGLDIHASELKVMTRGSEARHHIEHYKIVVLLVLLGVLACLLIAHILLKSFRKS